MSGVFRARMIFSAAWKTAKCSMRASSMNRASPSPAIIAALSNHWCASRALPARAMEPMNGMPPMGRMDSAKDWSVYRSLMTERSRSGRLYYLASQTYSAPRMPANQFSDFSLPRAFAAGVERDLLPAYASAYRAHPAPAGSIDTDRRREARSACGRDRGRARRRIRRPGTRFQFHGGAHSGSALQPTAAYFRCLARGAIAAGPHESRS